MTAHTAESLRARWDEHDPRRGTHYRDLSRDAIDALEAAERERDYWKSQREVALTKIDEAFADLLTMKGERDEARSELLAIRREWDEARAERDIEARARAENFQKLEAARLKIAELKKQLAVKEVLIAELARMERENRPKETE